ncbi:Spy/CpxP family protein refolding chaperone [Hyphomicrobium sp.]|uniref:Spy/CpxP family protein refolding chaperone n=1 Tax=Hyphomicrobium sp. TaxID=82 RepID=UPI002D77BF80|nr:Spy/CpxP family protein refolding chaperone [Hyphomicrobium sp.]HET6390184.1 Spy/CpxP family protein refolding chaperone [Hyphomicrobium sp.]
MKTLSRGTWIALAAVIAVPATIAIAKPGEKMSPETRTRLQEGKLAMVKTALQLTPDQEKLWAPVETQVREGFKARQAAREEWKKKIEERKAEQEKGGEQKRADLADRIQKMSQRMSERADRMKAFSAAFSPFYASLTDEQKDVLRPLMKQLMHHGRGHKFAGGWGPGGRHGGWSGHEGKGGPMMQDNDDDRGEPDKKG